MSTRHRVMTFVHTLTHSRRNSGTALLTRAAASPSSRRTTQMLSLVVNSLSLNLGAAPAFCRRALARSR